MKKGEKIPKKKVVKNHHDGTTYVLNPGHSVYELNLNTDPFEVKEARLQRAFRLFFWRGPIYKIKDRAPHLLHIPAHDLYNAKIRFKQMTSQLTNKQGKHVKIKGL